MWEDMIEKILNTKTLNLQLDGPASLERLQMSSSLVQDWNRTLDTQSQELLLVALGRALHGLTGDQAFPITMEGHGRESIDPAIDVSNTLGWFTTMYPLILEHDEDLVRNVQDVRHNVKKIPNRGVGYGSIYGYVDPPLPQVSFNFLGHLSPSRPPGGTAWKPEHAMNGDYGL
jgi:Condensation domain